MNDSAELFFFNRRDLMPLADKLGEQYRSAAPFPHIVIDDLLPEPVIRRVAADFPTPEAGKWRQQDRSFEVKLSAEDEEAFPGSIRHLMYCFNSSVFTEFLERLTGIQGLMPDPHFRGGGMHQIRRSGKLGVHADFNFYERLQVHRRVNVLLYLNDEWSDDYGGHLELWDRQMTRAEKKIAPLFNRCVVFSTTDGSNHGHPDPLNCPENRTRRSLALYYYTAERPETELSNPHPTLFRARPGESMPAVYVARRKLGAIARQVLPSQLMRLVGPKSGTE